MLFTMQAAASARAQKPSDVVPSQPAPGSLDAGDTRVYDKVATPPLAVVYPYGPGQGNCP